MPDKAKGLADNQDGDFILNETGTSVRIDRPDSDVSGHFVEAENKTEETEDNKQGENS